MKKFGQVLFGVATLFVLIGCEVEFEETYDYDKTRAEDLQAIYELIAEKGWPEPDTTESGARYIIFKEGDASGETVKQQDIVYFNYIGFYLDGVVFDTSIPEVADTAFTFTGDLVFEPQSYTYTETGWTLRYVAVVAQYLNGPSLSTAMMEAITQSFAQMTEGDRVLIFLPSYEVTTQSRSQSNTVPLYFEVTIDRIIGS